ncbi:type II toxin-antitoxin system RelE/ParE family toxin [Paenibacillus piri]|uniref:Type II toxin-antitoxin system RelE/ParE family toxin n=1 Tax=Paenibacillus piri TaxID=2547395 RepID=A0A4R5KIR7_9BACL|nr:type II toxin-antitoxin system RelE/ParE family toxin [Paenibacillus piri]TDF95373.1 type II toxin-antitoxin system RelE/ParE family toxin [Paenibacillus piri]
MRRYNIVITEPAEADLRGIAEYIALELKEPSTAQNLITKIGEFIFELEIMPYRYALVNDERLASQGIRMLLVDNYIVFYVVSETHDSVTVIRIVYGKREWSRIL